ncbi:MAG: class I mannose-6-phosphate isomerase [Candidatus Acidiferrum sp.]
MKPEPSRIDPVFSPRPWGARSLAPLFPSKTNLADPLGEAWLTSVDCRFATGPFSGATLGAAWREMSTDWRGTRLAALADFPLLVKFIFPNEKLSIQVHPGDDYAAVREKSAGGRGKTEMWHAVSAEPGAHVLLGLKPGVNKEKLLAELNANTVEELFVTQPVKAGDTFFIPAGTPHTIGSGMILCEVQQYSDLTYRLYDYGRLGADGKPRALHIEKALEVMKFENTVKNRVKSLPLPSHDAFKLFLAACPYFATESWQFSSDFSSSSAADHFEIFVILSGTGILQWKGGEQQYQAGECWLIPAALGQFELKPKENSSLIRTYVPDLPALRDELRREGISEMKLASVFFG